MLDWTGLFEPLSPHKLPTRPAPRASMHPMKARRTSAISAQSPESSTPTLRRAAAAPRGLV